VNHRPPIGVQPRAANTKRRTRTVRQTGNFDEKAAYAFDIGRNDRGVVEMHGDVSGFLLMRHCRRKALN
jgi:hypothetical protein